MIPQPGDHDVRGYVLAPGRVEALQSIYGQQSADVTNPLVFSLASDTNLAPGTEVKFDVAENSNGTVFATNVRRA